MTEKKYLFQFRTHGGPHTIDGEIVEDVRTLSLTASMTEAAAQRLANSMLGRDALAAKRHAAAYVDPGSRTLANRLLTEDDLDNVLETLAFSHSDETGQSWTERTARELDIKTIAALLELMARDAELDENYTVSYDEFDSRSAAGAAEAAGVRLTDLMYLAQDADQSEQD